MTAQAGPASLHRLVEAVPWRAPPPSSLTRGRVRPCVGCGAGRRERLKHCPSPLPRQLGFMRRGQPASPARSADTPPVDTTRRGWPLDRTMQTASRAMTSPNVVLPPPQGSPGARESAGDPSMMPLDGRQYEPGELRRLANMDIKHEYSLAMHVDAVNTLLERAYGFDAGGQLELAFFYYLRVISVLSKLRDHPCWPAEQQAQSATWHRCHHLFKQTQTLVARATHLEERLQARVPGSERLPAAEQALNASHRAAPASSSERDTIGPARASSSSARLPPLPSPSTSGAHQKAPTAAYPRPLPTPPTNNHHPPGGSNGRRAEPPAAKSPEPLASSSNGSGLHSIPPALRIQRPSGAPDSSQGPSRSSSLRHASSAPGSGLPRPGSQTPAAAAVIAPPPRAANVASSRTSSPVPSLSNMTLTSPARAYRRATAPHGQGVYLPQSLIPSGQSPPSTPFEYPALRSSTSLTPGQLIPSTSHPPLSVPPSAAAVPGRPVDGPQPFANGHHYVSPPPSHPAPSRAGLRMSPAHQSLTTPLRSNSHPTLPTHNATQATNQILVPNRPIKIGLTGLKNMGNTCYMNSVLQCLSATPSLAQFFIRGEHHRYVNPNGSPETTQRLLDAFAQLLSILWSEQYSAVAPMPFRAVLCHVLPIFGGWEQHDCHEFLSFFADALHEGLNRSPHSSRSKGRSSAEDASERRAQEAELEVLPIEQGAQREWDRYQQTNCSIVLDSFAGLLRNRMTCSKCSTTSTTYNVFRDLSLPVPLRSPRSTSARSSSQLAPRESSSPASNYPNIYDAFHSFLAPETLDGEDKWMCPKCRIQRKATKQLTLARLPPHLVIHLKRFSFQSSHSSRFSLSPRSWYGPKEGKISVRLDFPLDGLNLTSYAPAGEKGLYDLYAVVHHFGSLTSGHYTATVRSQGRWFYADDARIIPDFPKELYVRFYPFSYTSF